LYSYITIRSLDYAAFDSFFKKGKAQKITKNLIEAYSKATNFDHLFFTRSILTKNVEIYDLLLKGCKVLDVGCGSGEWIFKMSNLFPNSTFIGIDKDENSIKIASSKIKSKNVHFYKKDAKNIDYLNEFEIVNLCEVLCVTKNKEKVLSASYRALKKGGYMIIVEGLIEKPKRDLINKILYPMQLDMALQGGSFLSKNELIKLLSKYSLKTEFIDAGGGLWFILCKKY
jgi:Methylase involved in ubiquinone/menaquinone biosynthesis